jgi:hypothetical protein
MSIYGIGAFYEEGDVSDQFINSNLIGVGWSFDSAPELHQFIKSLKVGDIVYIKSFPPSLNQIIVKAIGIIINSDIITNDLVSCGRSVNWLATDQFSIPKPVERNNVRQNTIYEEYHPSIQQQIINRIIS